ncbi:hypothetical protein [Undibacterium sp. CCC3.4]|uniref:hypothetical protein n=1 Tax=Undibacterium sp. CCC3.4 TaxID=3048609 RepID=UPI002AC9150E|nr:hypothetical protein [Undibacterium sp. CCC3.4]WPX41990.1 hypothetical protein RHM61_11270 [Undibacterium sp. CCC3.4]
MTTLDQALFGMLKLFYQLCAKNFGVQRLAHKMARIYLRAILFGAIMAESVLSREDHANITLT